MTRNTIITLFFLATITLAFQQCKSNQLLKITSKENPVSKDTPTHIQQSGTNITCANFSGNFSETNNSLIFRGNRNNNLYLKRRKAVDELFFEDDLNECEKIHFVFLGEVETKDNEILVLQEVIDANTFKLMNSYFYQDSFGIYAYQDIPVRYPSLIQLPIKPSRATLVCSEYIKDHSVVFWKSYKLKNADPGSFSCSELTTSNQKVINIAHDDFSLYFNDTKMTKDRFEALPLEIKTKTTLRNKYFSK